MWYHLIAALPFGRPTILNAGTWSMWTTRAAAMCKVLAASWKVTRNCTKWRTHWHGKKGQRCICWPGLSKGCMRGIRRSWRGRGWSERVVAVRLSISPFQGLGLGDFVNTGLHSELVYYALSGLWTWIVNCHPINLLWSNISSGPYTAILIHVRNNYICIGPLALTAGLWKLF